MYLLRSFTNIFYFLSLTDSYIQHLTQQTFRSTLQDSTPLAIRHLTKKSIASGIKKVYQQVSTQKWKRVTELSVLVLQQLDSPDVQPEPPTTSAGRSTEMDEMAPLTTQSFCELYRSAWCPCVLWLSVCDWRSLLWFVIYLCELLWCAVLSKCLCLFVSAQFVLLSIYYICHIPNVY